MARVCVKIQDISLNYVGYAPNLTCGRELEECLSGDPVEEFALEGGLDLG